MELPPWGDAAWGITMAWPSACLCLSLRSHVTAAAHTYTSSLGTCLTLPWVVGLNLLCSYLTSLVTLHIPHENKEKTNQKESSESVFCFWEVLI